MLPKFPVLKISFKKTKWNMNTMEASATLKLEEGAHELIR